MWVFCGGMQRAGSTLQFQLAAHLVEQAELGVRLTFERPESFSDVRDQALRTLGDDAWKVFKTHRLTDPMIELCLHGRVKALHIYRDIRDVMASAMVHRSLAFDVLWERDFLGKCIEQHDRWLALGDLVLVSRYEQMITNLPQEVERIAAHLGIELKNEQAGTIAAEYELERQQERMAEVKDGGAKRGGFDASTLLHVNHITGGGNYRKELTAEQVLRIEQRHGDWLIEHGYPLDNPDAPGTGDEVVFASTAVLPDATNLAKSTHLYFSQNGEDWLLWQLFGDHWEGVFVDVGAFDGVHLSNSYSFELASWRGLCVEADPRFHALCEKARPNTHCVHAACVGDGSKASVQFVRQPLGLMSGLDVDTEAMRLQYVSRGIAFEEPEAIDVPARTLDAMLESCGLAESAIDFVSIDVEGAELEVLHGFDLRRFQPRVLVMEANDDANADALRRYLEGLGYHFARQVGPNLFFTRGAADARTLRRIAGSCTIEATWHPLGRVYSRRRLARRRTLHFEPVSQGIFEKARAWLRGGRPAAAAGESQV